MRSLNGQDIVDFVQERQAKQVRGLRQAYRVFPMMSVVCLDQKKCQHYESMLRDYAEDILVQVDSFVTDDIAAKIDALNKDDAYQGIVAESNYSTQVSPHKDLLSTDGLAIQDPVLVALDWLLAGYNIDLNGKNIAVIGDNSVANRIFKKFKADHMNVELAKSPTTTHDIVISAAGRGNSVNSDQLKSKAVVVDFGELISGSTDLLPEVYQRNDISVTPQKNGVAPLFVSAVIDNLINACLQKIPTS